MMSGNRRLKRERRPFMPRVLQAGDGVTEADLTAMMRDPRYWRDREPEFVRRVKDGFGRLFGAGARL